MDVHKYGFDAVPQQRMSCGNEGIRRGDDFPGDTQGLQAVTRPKVPLANSEMYLTPRYSHSDSSSC